MLPKYIPKYIRMPTGIRREFRTYEIEILNILIDKQMYKFKNKCIELFRVLPDNSLVAIRKEIKKKINVPGKIEDLLLKYFDRYKIQEPIKRKYIRKKEDPQKDALRVKKYRTQENKTVLQINLKVSLKNKFDKLKKEQGMTSSQFLSYLMR